MAEKFDSLEEHLEKFVENIRQLGIIVSDFQPSSQTGLNQKLNFMVTGLQDIDKCRQQLHDISVPLEVFEYIDQGRNPQLYTKECLERALAKNEQVKGKIDTMKRSRKVDFIGYGKKLSSHAVKENFAPDLDQMCAVKRQEENFSAAKQSNGTASDVYGRNSSMVRAVKH
uniref:mediator of RNA polymerase II transcription subunit 10 isoform X1 n=1 Tax=Agelaius phoeniceus TaxID=39638 RepID=UPI0023EC067B|nr:mediator of RNA polymerase II transcription subunit 10 isoform X1 [Agelaius phoeniceus]